MTRAAKSSGYCSPSSSSSSNIREELFQELCNRIVHHDADESGLDWPEVARSMRTTLLQASNLPRWVTAGPYPAVDDGLEYLLGELHEHSKAFGGPSGLRDDPLAPVFASAIRTCDLVRLQRRQLELDNSAPNYGTVLVYALMAACSHIDRDVLLEDDARFGMPRVPGTHPAMHYVCDGLRVPLVAAVLAGDTDRFSVRGTVRSPETELIGGLPHQDDAGEEVRWVPPSTHVFRHWEPSTTTDICGHPFLCMATKRTLAIAMSAVLHQRRAWGLSHPVIGVVFDPTATEITFVVGWYEDNPQRAAFPVVHLCNLGSRLTFDLVSPQHILAVYHTILSLRSLVSDLRSDAALNVPILRRPVNIFDQWRADSFNFWLPFEKIEDRVHRWLDDVIVTPSTDRQVELENNDGGALQAAEEPHVQGATDLLNPDDNAASERDRYMRYTSQLSVSKGSLKSAQDSGNCIINDFLLDRYAFPVSTAANQKHWNDFSFYTRILWPVELVTCDDQGKYRPASDYGLTLPVNQLEAFHEIFSALHRFKSADPACKRLVHEISSGEQSPDAELLGHICKALPLIIEVYSMLRSIQKKSERNKKPVNEATWRVPIDMLHMHLFGDKKHAIEESIVGWASSSEKSTADGNNQMERTLRLPMNLAFHCHIEEDDERRNEWGEQLMLRTLNETQSVPRVIRRIAPFLRSNAIAQALREADAGSGKSNAQPRKIAAQSDLESDAYDWEIACVSEVSRRAHRWSRRLDETSVVDRAALMSGTGIADALAYVRLPVQVPKQALREFALAPVPSSGASGAKETPGSAVSGQPATKGDNDDEDEEDDRGKDDPPALKKRTVDPDFDQWGWQPDIYVACEKDVEPVQPVKDGENHVDLPIVLAEWKKKDGDMRQAVNQHLVNHVAGARFLEVCGIVDTPVFGMTANGPQLTLDYAYTDQTSEPDQERLVLIANRHPVCFDLTSPMGIWRLATALIAINRLHIPKLLDAWNAARAKYSQTAPGPNTPPHDPSWLHTRSKDQRQLPQWTMKREDVRNLVSAKVAELRKRYEGDPEKAHLLPSLEKTEKMVKKAKQKQKADKGTPQAATAEVQETFSKLVAFQFHVGCSV